MLTQNKTNNWSCKWKAQLKDLSVSAIWGSVRKISEVCNNGFSKKIGRTFRHPRRLAWLIRIVTWKWAARYIFWQHLTHAMKHVFLYPPKATLNKRFSTQIYLRLPWGMLSHIWVYSFNAHPRRFGWQAFLDLVCLSYTRHKDLMHIERQRNRGDKSSHSSNDGVNFLFSITIVIPRHLKI